MFRFRLWVMRSSFQCMQEVRKQHQHAVFKFFCKSGRLSYNDLFKEMPLACPLAGARVMEPLAA